MVDLVRDWCTQCTSTTNTLKRMHQLQRAQRPPPHLFPPSRLPNPLSIMRLVPRTLLRVGAKQRQGRGGEGDGRTSLRSLSNARFAPFFFKFRTRRTQQSTLTLTWLLSHLNTYFTQEWVGRPTPAGATEGKNHRTTTNRLI